MEWIMIAVVWVLTLLPTVLVGLVFLVLLTLVGMFIADVAQTKDAIRRNYPIVGRFRYFFSTLGEFFRQYFFAMDREEMPFNRAQREWVYKSAAGVDNTVAFGSTKSIAPVGTALFVNCAFPTLDEEALEPAAITLGPYCRFPYTATSLFNISGMSYGAISKPAVQALSKGAQLAKCWLNTGEGGLSPYHLEGKADLVFQIGTAKYGVRTPDGQLDEAKLKTLGQCESIKMFEIKLSQGAKPGKGGILPGCKVTPQISQIRGIPAGQDSISPNRHPEIQNNEQLLDFIDRVRQITGKPTGIKAVIGDLNWVRNLCQTIVKRGIESAPDFFTIDSCDAGTGAAPMPLMDSVGLPIKEALPLVVNELMAHGLHPRVRVIASGKLIVPSEVSWALCAGADFVVSARGPMFALGCIQALKCNKNVCPTGVTTHNKRLQKGLNPKDKSVKVANYVKKIMYGVGLIAHSCGVQEPRQLRRHHVRIVQQDGTSTSFDQLFPEAQVNQALENTR